MVMLAMALLALPTRCVGVMVRLPPAACTMSEKVAVSEPPELVAVRVYVVLVLPFVGVPERTQVFERERPEGSDGETLQETMVPPLFETLTAVMAVPFTSSNEEGAKVMEGTTSFTLSVRFTEWEPAELLAHTV